MLPYLADFDLADSSSLTHLYYPWLIERPYVQLQYPYMAGLEPAILYMRSEAQKLWNYLDDNKFRFLHICGHPGTEKSSVVCSWAWWQAYKMKTDALCIHFTKDRCSVVHWKEGGIGVYMSISNSKNYMAKDSYFLLSPNS